MKTQFNLHQGRNKLALRLLSFALAVALIFGQRTSVISAFAGTEPDGEIVYDETYTPNDETPDDETPDDETPDDETPDDETPDGETPDDETPDDETPDDETPDDETPDDETPDDEVPEVVPATEITVQLDGEIQDFSGIRVILAQADGTELEQAAVDAYGTAGFVLPADGDAFRLFISGMTDDLEIVEQGWKLDGGIYSKEFSREALENNGLINVAVTKAVVAPEPFKLTIKITEKVAGVMAGLARGVTDWFSGGNINVTDLTVEVYEYNGGTRGDKVGSSITNGQGEAEIEFIAGHPVAGSMYLMYIGGMQYNYEIVGWDLDGIGYSKQFSGQQLLDGSGMRDIQLQKKSTAELFVLSVSAYHPLEDEVFKDKNNDAISAEITIVDRNSGAEYSSSIKELLAVGGEQWILNKDYKYRVTLTTPSDTVYLHQSGYNAIAELSTPGSFGFKQVGGHNVYTFEIDIPKTDTANMVTLTTTFVEANGDLKVEKEYDGYNIGNKTAYIGIYDSVDGTTIDWKEIPANRTVSYINLELYKHNSTTGVADNTKRSFTIFEYVPADCAPQGVDSGAWTWIQNTNNYKPLPTTDSGYLLYVRKLNVTFPLHATSVTETIINEEAKLIFDGSDASADFASKSTIEISYAKFRDWQIQKKVSLDGESFGDSATVKLDDRGEPFSAYYQVTFTKQGGVLQPSYRLYFKKVALNFLYDTRAAGGNNSLIGDLCLYRLNTTSGQYEKVDTVHVDRLLSSGSSLGDGRSRIDVNTTLMDPDYKPGSKYMIKFEGGYYYKADGNPDLTAAPYKTITRTSYVTDPIVDLPSDTSEIIEKNLTIKDFIDAIANSGNFSVDSIEYISVNGSSKTIVKDVNGFKINGQLVPAALFDGDTITVKYKVNYTDRSEENNLSPCTSSYDIKNTASGVPSDEDRRISDYATITVNIPTYATIDVEKFDQDDKGESGVTFTLKDKVSGNTLGSVTTDASGKGTIMSVADSTKALRKWNPDGTERYILEVTIPYPDYPPFSKGADGELVKWTKVDEAGYKWSREISFRQQSSTDPYPGKYCGTTTVVVYDKSDTELKITKTGRGITEATFYLFDSSGKFVPNQTWKFNSVTEAAAGRIIKNLAPGSYTLYELVTKGFSPQGDGWTPIALADYPTTGGIPKNLTHTLYKKTITVGGDKSSAEVVNGEWQKLKITKTATGLHSASEKFKFKVFNEAGVVQKFTKKASPAVDTYVFDPSGLVTELELELTTVDGIGKSITIEKLEPGKYTVEEIIPQNGTTPLYTVTGGNPESVTIGADTGVTSVIVPAVFENNLVTAGKITVKKAVDGGTIDSESFTFTVTKKIGGAAPSVVHQLTGSNITFDVTGGNISNGAAGQFTLKAGVTATLKNLTPGDVYIITEASTNGKFTTNHTITVGTGTAEPGTGSVTKDIPVTGRDTAVVFTNERIGDAKLYVSKVVPSTTFIDADENPVFTLQVSGLFKETNGGVVSIVQGTRDILFAKNAGNVGGKTVYAWNTSVLVPDVINGCEYIVEEIGDALTKYTPSYNPTSRKATAGIGSSATVTVTNANKGGGVLTIEKALAGSTENTRPFTVYLRNGSNPLYFTKSASGNTYTYSPTATGGASRDITISVDQKAIINGLPLGMVITVEEQGLAGTGYTVAYSDNDYTMAGDKTITVTNTATPVLTVAKTVENPGLVGTDEFKITVTGKFSDPTKTKEEIIFSSPFNGTPVTVPGVLAGETYTVTETKGNDTTDLAYYTTTATGLDNKTDGNRQGEVTILATNTATAPAKVVFNNKRESGGGSLKVKKVVSDVDSESGKEIFVVTVTGEFSDGDTSKTVYFSKTALSAADKASHVPNATYALWGQEAQIPNVILGYTYNVSETDVIGGALGNYDVLVTGGGSIKVPVGSVTAVVTNTREDSVTGTLNIEKTLKTGSQEGATGFTVNIKNANTGALLNFTNIGTKYTLAKSGGSPTITVSEAGGAVTVTGLLLNVPLKVVEVDSTGKEVTEYNVTYTGFDADGNVTLTNASQSRNVTIDNDGTKGTELYVTKKMGNSIDAGTDQFTIEVTGFFAGETVEKTQAFTFGKTASETPKVYAFGTSAEVTGVIGGNTYTITEINSDGAVLGKYTTTVAATAGAVWTDDATGRGGSLALKPGQKLTVTVTNTRKTNGQLTVTKNVNGGVWNATDKFTFTLLNEDGTPAANITGTPDGKFTLTGVTGGNSTKFTNLTVGAKYKVVEEDPGKNYEFVIYNLNGATSTGISAPIVMTAYEGSSTLTVTNAKNTGKAKVTKTVNFNGLPGLTGKTFTFKFGLFDASVTPTKDNALEIIDIDYVANNTATHTKEFAYDLIPDRNYVVRELDKDNNPIDDGKDVRVGDDDQQFKVGYENVSGSTPVNYVTTYTYNVTNTALVSRGIITKILNDTADDPLYKFFTFGIFDESDKQVGDAYEIEVKEVSDGVWEGKSEEIFLVYGEKYTVKELSAFKEKDDDGKPVGEISGTALAEVFKIGEPKSIPDDNDAISDITHNWSFTATNTKKTASAEIIKELIVSGSAPIHTKFVFDLIGIDGLREWVEQKDIELTVTKDPITGEWLASKTIDNLDPRYGYTFKEKYETELKNEGFEINPVDRDAEGIGSNHIKYTCVITNSEPDTKTAHARIQKILYTDYTNPQREFSFNIMETKDGVTRVFGSYTLSVLQTASNRYENTSQLITGLDPDATYTIVEQNRQTLLNAGYTIREVATVTDVGTPVTNWTFTVTNTRYRNGGGGGGGSRLTRDGGTTTNVPLSTIPDTEVPLTTIPNSPTPLANLPVTGRRVAALLGSAGLILLGVTIKTRRKDDDD